MRDYDALILFSGRVRTQLLKAHECWIIRQYVPYSAPVIKRGRTDSRRGLDLGSAVSPCPVSHLPLFPMAVRMPLVGIHPSGDSEHFSSELKQEWGWVLDTDMWKSPESGHPEKSESGH